MKLIWQDLAMLDIQKTLMTTYSLKVSSINIPFNYKSLLVKHKLHISWFGRTTNILLSYHKCLYKRNFPCKYCPCVLCCICPPVLHCDHEPPDWSGSQWHQSSNGDCQAGVNNLPDQHDQWNDGPPHHLCL